jgi:eukaryotic-like serine/threonine-protein kinase
LAGLCPQSGSSSCASRGSSGFFEANDSHPYVGLRLRWTVALCWANIEATSMRSLGKYRLVHEIARGGMGVVHLAVVDGPHSFRKLHVIKELLPEFSNDANMLEMFHEEARLAARLSHPNVVQTHEVASTDGAHYMVVEFLDGRPLSRVLNARIPGFSPNLHMSVLVGVLRGLAYAHSLTDYSGAPLQIVHRDVSPSNVFVTFDGQVKLLDFGIAKSAYSVNKTQTGTFKGKPTYVAPEQVTGTVDKRTDIFSVGVMMWEGLTRRRMWRKATELEVVGHLLKGEIPNLRSALAEIGRPVPENLIRICERALAVDPDARYSTADEFASDLETSIAKLGLATPQLIADAMLGAFGDERKAMYAELDRIGPHETGAHEALRSVFVTAEGNRASLTPSMQRVQIPTAAAVPREVSEQPTRLTASTSLDSLAAPLPKDRKSAVLLVVAALGLCAGGGALVLSKNAGSDPRAGATTAPHTAAPVPTATQASTYHLQVQTTPTSATVTVNGFATVNKASIPCESGAKLKIEATQAGFDSATQEAVCDRDALVDLKLPKKVSGGKLGRTGGQVVGPGTSAPKPSSDIRIER